MSTTPKPHIPGPCDRVGCNGYELSGLSCDSSPDVCPKYRRLITTGISLITAERKRQVEQEGWTPEHDAKHTKGELAQAACYYCWPDASEGVCRSLLFPDTWAKRHAKREGDKKPTLRDLVKSGALIAAEIDRRLAAGERE